MAINQKQEHSFPDSPPRRVSRWYLCHWWGASSTGENRFVKKSSFLLDLTRGLPSVTCWTCKTKRIRVIQGKILPLNEEVIYFGLSLYGLMHLSMLCLPPPRISWTMNVILTPTSRDARAAAYVGVAPWNICMDVVWKNKPAAYNLLYRCHVKMGLGGGGGGPILPVR